MRQGCGSRCCRRRQRSQRRWAWQHGRRQGPHGGGEVSSITISNEQGTTWTCGFNPYNAYVVPFSFGAVYEELMFRTG